MSLFLAALAAWLTGGCLAILLARHARLASTLGALSVVAGCVLTSLAAGSVLAGGAEMHFEHAWQLPLGTLSLALDSLSAFFLLPIALVCGLAAIYGCGYWRTYEGRKNLGAAWCFFNLLTASMALVVTARNGMLFLIAWEMMSLVSFLLVMFEDEEEEVRRAGWTYLVASHLGTAFLLALFVLLGRHADSLDFRLFAVEPKLAGIAFLMAIVGFGTKAGFVPLHVWLPEAHPAAPSHVSAVMSGVMIKMGIYGLLRTLTFLGPPAAWWGWLLVGIGVSSGVLGVLFALAQHDLKRLLAYCSVENVGIIALGLGVGLLGICHGNAAMASLGLAGAVLHVLNHALFKSLLFLATGAVLHATGTRQIDRLGGLMRRMPSTGTAFLLGSAAICSLPPLGGFISELLIYLGAFQGLLVARTASGAATAGLLVIGSLALTGGLAAACFAKAFGIVFLGEPRSDEAQAAHESGAAMRVPMLGLTAACGLAGILGPLLLTLVAPVVLALLPPDLAAAASRGLETGRAALIGVWAGSMALIALVAGLIWLRSRLLAGREVAKAVTWDCGYAAPKARMQYTGSSFAQPLVDLFRVVLGTKDRIDAPQDLFARHAALHTETPDLFRDRICVPVFAAFYRVALRLHGLQQGRIQLYVLYIAMVLIVLLVWKLG